MVFLLRLHEATPSNCGNPLKPLIPSMSGNGYVAKRKNLGMVKIQWMIQWAIRSQVLKRKTQWMLFRDLMSVGI